MTDDCCLLPASYGDYGGRRRNLKASDETCWLSVYDYKKRISNRDEGFMEGLR